jgi:hypothetical protein
VSKINRLRELIPPWEMPSDPIKAVWWFLHWLLKILVRVFWLPILIMVMYEIYINGSVSGILNGVVSGVVTLFVGLVVWIVLYGILAAVNIGTGISRIMSDMNRMQQQQREFLNHSYTPFMRMDGTQTRDSEMEGQVVEGTITELDEERRKRRSQ